MNGGEQRYTNAAEWVGPEGLHLDECQTKAVPSPGPGKKMLMQARTASQVQEGLM
jgi:hypothetical protein